MRTSWPQLRVITFSRNCGHQAALTAGLHRSHGDYVVSIDADLQDPPGSGPARRHGLRSSLPFSVAEFVHNGAKQLLPVHFPTFPVNRPASPS